ncbi:MAG: type I 3-dehydroquinate dehydratase, partial [Phycisphaerales bacterium]|nr:type I 3-dehydroquinate dehydratase [Phycisphaerales bacterium]
MTLVAVPIFVDTSADIADAHAAAAAAAAAGATLVEWRVDRLGDEDAADAAVRRLLAGSPLPAILTCRSVAEGGHAEDPARALALLAAATRAESPPRYVDLELTLTDHPAAAAVIDGVAASGEIGLLLSTHDFDGRPPDLLQRIERMTTHPHAAVVKVAWMARSLRDNLEAFDLLHARRTPTIALCMGPFGLPSRVLAGKFGGLITFASSAPGAESAPGQPTLADLERCGFERVGDATRVYGVLGWPIGHSRSPTLHNAVFRQMEWDGVYLPLPVPPEWEHFKATVGAWVDHPTLGFRGASVTLPHKTHLVRFVRERGGVVGPEASAIGAANTLVVGDDDAIACVNTDVPALRATLLAGMRTDTL